MKKKLKYLEAVFLISSIGLWFMPLIDISILNLSLIDVIKVGIGKYKSIGIIGEIYKNIQKYLEPYTYGLLLILVIILLGALITVVLTGIKAYVAAGISCIVNNIAAIIFFMKIKSKLDEVQDSISLLDVSQLIQFSIPTILMWIVLYIVIFVLAICGIIMWKTKEEEQRNEDVFINIPAHISTRSYVTEDYDFKREVRQRYPSDRKKNEDRDFSEKAEEVNTVFQERLVSQPKSTVSQRGTLTCQNLDRRKQNNESVKEMISQRREFGGAILGEAGIYKQKVYPLKDTWEIYFDWKEGHVVISEKKSESCLAGIYFISEYQEYCVTPQKTKSFFLESGQPLGIGRHYYLPRGTRVYINEVEQLFRLT